MIGKIPPQFRTLTLATLEVSQQAAVRIATAYMTTLVQGHPRRVLAICEMTGLSRSTFYNHFENLEDLDNRFLQVYVVDVLGEGPTVLTTASKLRAFYRNVIEVMQRQLQFFEALLQSPRLVRYRIQWFELIEARLQATLGQQGGIPDLRHWTLHLDLAIGVLRRFQEIAIGKTGSELSDTVELMTEYLWAGYRRLREVSAGSAPSWENEHNRILAHRHQTQPVPTPSSGRRFLRHAAESPLSIRPPIRDSETD